MTAKKRLAFTALAVLLAVGLSVGVIEILLRLSGRSPWRSLNLRSSDPIMYERDPVLGWSAKPGHYMLPAYSAEAPNVPVTVLKDGTRTTGSRDGVTSPVAAIVGCSFTFGMAIADNETFAWRLQQRLPSARILNYGRGGYGTYQSLLLLERILGRSPAPRLVVYGFVELHETRNVAAVSWLRALELLSKGGIVATPYVTLADDGRLLRHPPIHHPRWPLRESLASVALLEQGYSQAFGAAREQEARPVTESLLLEMDRLTRSRGVRFLVVVLHVSPAAKAHYLFFLHWHGIEVIDCALELRPALQVRGEGHPNGQANERWAACIVGTLGDALAVPTQRLSGRGDIPAYRVLP